MAIVEAAPSISHSDTEHFLLNSISVVRSMNVKLHSHDSHQLSLRMDLASNLNDKGCAFGGSLSSLLTFSGWGLIALQLRQGCMSYEIYIQDSTIEYLLPVYEEIKCSARIAIDDRVRFYSTLSKHDRARINVTSTIHLEDGRSAAILRGRYAVKIASTNTQA
jgi:thioesterase domain-containing protein